jgi:membrane associated rhomboid family serine protease
MHEGNPRVERALALAALMLPVLGVYALGLAQAGAAADGGFFQAWCAGAWVPDLAAAQPWRLVTAGLAHAEVGHLVANLIELAAAALAVAPRRGAAWCLTVAAVGAVAGAGASAALGEGWTLGASGAGWALWAAAAVSAARQPESMDRVGWAGLVVATTIGVLGLRVPAADGLAHLGGATVGTGAALLPAGRVWIARAALGVWVVVAGYGVARLAWAPGGAPVWRAGPAVERLCTATWTQGWIYVCAAEGPARPTLEAAGVEQVVERGAGLAGRAGAGGEGAVWIGPSGAGPVVVAALSATALWADEGAAWEAAVEAYEKLTGSAQDLRCGWLSYM